MEKSRIPKALEEICWDHLQRRPRSKLPVVVVGMFGNSGSSTEVAESVADADDGLRCLQELLKAGSDER